MTHHSGHHLNAKEPAVHPLGVNALHSPNVVHHLPKMETNATGAPHPGAGRASQDVVPLEGVLPIGVEIAGVKTVVDLMSHDPATRDHLSGIGNLVSHLIDDLDHLPMTTATQTLDTGPYLGTLHDRQHRRLPPIHPTPEETRECTQIDLSRLLSTIVVVLLRLLDGFRVSMAAAELSLASAEPACETLFQCSKCVHLISMTSSSGAGQHGRI